MRYIDPHCHMLSRTTDDYATMARMGCVAVSEPAFWASWDRSHVASFFDYFRHLTDYEPLRAARYGIEHYSWLCINAKEAEDRAMSRDVIAMIPEFLDRPNVLGIGEIGLNKNTRNEALTFLDQLDLAARHDTLVLVHTPHLVDKYNGTRMIIDMILRDSRLEPERVIIDHVEEHTIRCALDAGFWAGMTLYPITKCTPERAADLIDMYGAERLMANSACDWGPSTPLNVPNFLLELRRRGYDDATLDRIAYGNPAAFFGQSPKWRSPGRAKPDDLRP